MKVAISVKANTAGVHWTEDELRLKKDSLINSKVYDAKQQSLLKRFFATLNDYGGPSIAKFSDILVDEVGDTTRCVFYFNLLFFLSLIPLCFFFRIFI